MLLKTKPMYSETAEYCGGLRASMAVYRQNVKIPLERVGVLVGRAGAVKRRIEERCGVKLEIDSSSGDVNIVLARDIPDADPFKAAAVVTAIARGFSPERAELLLQDGYELRVVDLKEYGGRSAENLARIRGRIIGEGGRARRNIEELTESHISVYGHTVAIIARAEWAGIAEDAVRRLAAGSPHAAVYSTLQRARSRSRLGAARLWEEAVDA
jgi:ribosomal RNA assembly protein